MRPDTARTAGRRARAVAALAALVAIGLAACTTTVAGAGQLGASAPAGPSGPTPPSGSPSPGSLSQAQATSALLTAAQVGPAFRARPPAGAPSPPPCSPPGTPAITTQAPPHVQARREFDHRGLDAYVTQDVYGYRDVALAEAGLRLYEASFSCAQGTAYYANGSTGPLQISHPTAIGSSLGVDEGMVYDLKFTTEQGTVLVARIGPVLLLLTFLAPAQADQATLPNGKAIVTRAVRKIRHP